MSRDARSTRAVPHTARSSRRSSRTRPFVALLVLAATFVVGLAPSVAASTRTAAGDANDGADGAATATERAADDALPTSTGTTTDTLPPVATDVGKPAVVVDGVGRELRDSMSVGAYVVAVAEAKRLAAEEAQRQAVSAWLNAVAAAQAKAARDAVWDRIAACETGGNWAMQGSSFSGGVGFANSTWSAFGGGEFAPNAGMATREQQIIVAERVYDYGGYSGWGCAYTIGLLHR